MNTGIENIKNLQDLWRTVSYQADNQHTDDGFEYGLVGYSQWPNRLWFHGDAQEDEVLKAKATIRRLHADLIVPYWDIYESVADQLLEKHGFKEQFQQVGMQLELKNKFRNDQLLDLKEVQSAEEAAIWEDLFKRSFGYLISQKLLLFDYDATSFLTAYLNSTPVGTVILHASDENLLGIHAMGIIPEMRRKGLAREMMEIVLNRAGRAGYSQIVLQASAKGKGLYEQLGFREQFIMKNYKLE